MPVSKGVSVSKKSDLGRGGCGKDDVRQKLLNRGGRVPGNEGPTRVSNSRKANGPIKITETKRMSMRKTTMSNLNSPPPSKRDGDADGRGGWIVIISP